LIEAAQRKEISPHVLRGSVLTSSPEGQPCHNFLFDKISSGDDSEALQMFEGSE
jgi:hypothetical protein